METQADRLRRARIEAGFPRVRDALEQFPKWKANSYKSHDNGNAPFSFKVAQIYAEAFGVRPEWLYAGTPPMRGQDADGPIVRIIGTAGTSADGRVDLVDEASSDAAPMLPGLTEKAFAIEVCGGPIPGVAEDRSLIYVDGQETKPGKDMINRVIVAEDIDGRVFVTRLMRGADKGLFDLVSVLGTTSEGTKLRWAAHIRFIAPPIQAEQLIKRRKPPATSEAAQHA